MQNWRNNLNATFFIVKKYANILYLKNIQGGRSVKQLSLRTKLYIFLLIVLVPLLGFQFWGIFNQYHAAVNLELNANYEFADNVSSAFVLYLQNLWNIEQSIGASIVGGKQEWASEEIEKNLRYFLTIHPTIRSLSWIDPTGKIIADTSLSKNLDEISDYLFYKEIISGENEVVSDLITNSYGNEMTIAVARGIYQNRTLLGIIVAYLNIEKLDLILPLKTDKTDYFGIVDGKGMIIYQNGNLGLTYEQRRSNSSLAQLVLQKKPVISRNYFKDINGQEHLGASLPIPETGWTSFATAEINNVLTKIRSDTNQDIIILLLIGIIVTIVYGILIGDHFLKPLVKIQKTSLAISQGDLNARVGLEGSSELGTTGQIFDQMADRIQQLEVSRTRFLQTAAHELRNPMAGIKGILSLILHRIGNGKPINDMSNMFQIMEREIDRLSNLLNQILEAFRTQKESGMLSLDLKKTNLIEIIDSASKPFQFSERCKFIHDSINEDPVYIYGDFIRLEEVFRNLLSNAIKYSPEESEVLITLTVKDDHALVTIQDFGIGIPQSQLHGIFECLYRGSNLGKQDPGGMGLGLYICKEIINSHVGSIWAESVEGVGSTFFVKLPLY